MRKCILAAITAISLSILPAGAEEFKTTVWSTYGISFSAPADIVVEDESEESYSVSNSNVYISIQIMNGNDFAKDNLISDLKNIATDDQLTDVSDVNELDLKHFDVFFLEGKCDTDRCMYSYLMAKDGSSGFFISIIYGSEYENNAISILKSFMISE